MATVQPGDVVRRYEEDDWFREGMVITVKDDIATIEFDSWIERIPEEHLRVDYINFQRILLPTRPGLILEDFTDAVTA